MLLGESTVEGRYTLKIRDKNTGEIKDEFSFSNFVTDQVFYKITNYLMYVNVCYLAESLPTNVTEPRIDYIDAPGNNTSGSTTLSILNDASVDLFTSPTKIIISDKTKRKNISNGITTDVIDRVDRIVFNYTSSFIFNSGNTGAFKSLVICGGYQNGPNNYITAQDVFSYATIKRNGVPYTLNLGVNDILEVYYQFMLYDDVTTYPRTIRKTINNVPTNITLEKTNKSYTNLVNTSFNNPELYGNRDGTTNETRLSAYDASRVFNKISTGNTLIVDYVVNWLDAHIPSNSNITNYRFQLGVNNYKLTFNPPIRKSDYQEWSFSLRYKYTRKVSA